MKKIVTVIIVLILIVLCFFTFTACINGVNNNEPSPSDDDNSLSITQATHTQHISTPTEFEKFFTYSNAETHSTRQANYYAAGDPAFTDCKLTITIVPRVTGFVEYAGTISFRIVASQDSTGGGHHNEIIATDIFYTGKTIFEKNYHSDTFKDDSILLPHKGELGWSTFVNTYTLEIYSVDIAVTYHNEGLSGDYSQTYKTIHVTKYNYENYLFGKLKNSAYYVTIQYDTGEKVELTINGCIPESQKVNGTIIDVSGTVDIYPNATT